jgi:hypothetical protein
MLCEPLGDRPQQSNRILDVLDPVVDENEVPSAGLIGQRFEPRFPNAHATALRRQVVRDKRVDASEMQEPEFFQAV